MRKKQNSNKRKKYIYKRPAAASCPVFFCVNDCSTLHHFFCRTRIISCFYNVYINRKQYVGCFTKHDYYSNTVKGIILAREDELIRQIKLGRRECLDELVELYYPAILRYCMWHMPDKESAQDATQETFLKLVRFIDRYSHKGQFKAFLYRIAANTCIDIKRKIAASEFPAEPFSEEMLPADCRSENSFQRIEDRQQLAQALDCVNPEQRELILLRYGQQLSLKEISAVTGLPLRTVQTKIRRAMQKLNRSADA